MSTSHQLFITATDTGVGKTLVSGLFLDFLHHQGISACYQKWVATGCEGTVEDLERVRQLTGSKSALPDLDLQVPYRFPFPASPHLAAEQAGEEVDPARITAAYHHLGAQYNILVVEGVGGVLVPLRPDLLLIDLLTKLRIPTLVVARSGLGTINHTLLTLEALRRRAIPLLGVLLTDGPGEDETIAADNRRCIAELGQVRIFGRLPFGDDDQALRAAFAPLGNGLLAALRSP